VSIAACLLLYSLAVVVAGPPLLRRLTRGGHSPRLSVAAWLSAIGSVLISWLTAAVLVVFDVARHWDDPAGTAMCCLARLRSVLAGHSGVASQTALLVVAASATAGAVVFGMRLSSNVIRLRARAHEHAREVRIVGRHNRGGDVVVVDADKPAAYCVSGRPSAIVVTSSALATLDESELNAVLAHERAHLSGHHTHISAFLRSIAVVFARVPLMTAGAAEVSRLLEMCADDAAARRHGREALLSGLLALAGAAPAPALGAASLAVLTRAERLALPQRAPARVRFALSTILAIIAVGPLITVVLAASGTLLCGA
jgi:Zn-dependent protease with chaperone function